MRTQITLFVLAIFCSATIQAQKVVAVHSSTNGVQYFDGTSALQDAYAAAVATDTIYLTGGTFTPPSVFDKQLTIFGAGHHPDVTTATMSTTISSSILFGDNADGSYLEGVLVNGNIHLGDIQNISVNDLIIKRCKWGNLYASGTADTNTSNNNVFVENIFSRCYDVNNLRSSSFYNNIIENYHNGSLLDLFFANNVFTYSYSNSSYPIITYANNSVFKNNIFLQEWNYVCHGNGQSTWINNIFCSTSGNPALGLDPILTNNYYMSRANVLVDQTGATFDYAHNYHLQPGAAANLGDDGTETGLYGGTYVWKDYSIPTNPHISSKTISGTSDGSGNIQVDINVHAQTN